MATTNPPRMLAGDRQSLVSDVMQRAAQAAAGFKALGVAEDDVIALLLRNDFAFFEATLAAGQIGAYATPINWHATAAEAEYVLTDTSAKVLVVHTDLWPGIAAGVPADVKLLFVTTPPEILAAYKGNSDVVLPPDAVMWDAWVAQHAPLTSPPPDMRGVMIYTSGTTGKPKGVRRNAVNVQQFGAMSAATAAAYGLTPEQPMRVLMNGPMYHSAPNSYGTTSARLGADIVLQERFDPEQMLALIERHRITHMHIVPTMFYRLLQLPEDVKRRYDLSSLKDVVHGAAPCSPGAEAGDDRLVGAGYQRILRVNRNRPDGQEYVCRRAEQTGTVGGQYPAPGFAILDDEGREVGPGVIGDVYVKIAHMPDFTYHRQPDKRQAAGRNGYITVGDVGWLDEEGYLFLSDRKNDMVISGGVNIYPAEIEAVLLGIPGIKDCAVFGIPDAEFGEQLCAYVQREEHAAALTEADIRRQLSAQLAKFKIPRLIKFADSLPREDSGKIFKRKLRAPYWESSDRKI